MLGQREPANVRQRDARGCASRLRAQVAGELDFDLFFAQTNAEHQIVEWLHDAFREKATVVINPAGFSFHSVPVLDALRMLEARRSWRSTSPTSMRGTPSTSTRSSPSVARTVIAGAGVFGYELAIRAADRLTTEDSRAITDPA